MGVSAADEVLFIPSWYIIYWILVKLHIERVLINKVNDKKIILTVLTHNFYKNFLKEYILNNTNI